MGSSSPPGRFPPGFRRRIRAMSSPRVRFIMIGGFLGAGKTTAIARLARHYIDAGASGSASSPTIRPTTWSTRTRCAAQGFDVGEVPGACFCCKFNDLVDDARQADRRRPRRTSSSPSRSAAAPTWSRRSIEPLKHFTATTTKSARWPCCSSPSTGCKILRGEQDVGFSPKAAYIFLKQIEEADVDRHQQDRQARRRRARGAAATGRRAVSRQAGAALSAPRRARASTRWSSCSTEAGRVRPRRSWTSTTTSTPRAKRNSGWLNCSVASRRAKGRSRSTTLLVGLVEPACSRRWRETGAEAAHLKAHRPVGRRLRRGQPRQRPTARRNCRSPSRRHVDRGRPDRQRPRGDGAGGSGTGRPRSDRGVRGETRHRMLDRPDAAFPPRSPGADA